MMTSTQTTITEKWPRPSLQSRYALEREGIMTIERPDGYCTYLYLIEEESIYLVDIYVVPESRRSRVCYELADQVADIGRENGFKWMLGSVDPTTNGATESCKVILNYGYNLSHYANGLIWFKKGLE